MPERGVGGVQCPSPLPNGKKITIGHTLTRDLRTMKIHPQQILLTPTILTTLQEEAKVLGPKYEEALKEQHKLQCAGGVI
jgi:hypothetical protein